MSGRIKPIPYGSSKKILKYMDPRMRVFLVEKRPNLRTAEKKTPFFINELVIEGNQFFIRDTCDHLTDLPEEYLTGRSITVNNLVYDDVKSPLIQKLPDNFKVLILEQITVDHKAAARFESIMDIIDEKSLPLKKVVITGWTPFLTEADKDYNHPLIQSAELISFQENEKSIAMLFFDLPYLANPPNKRINTGCSLETEDVNWLVVINYWIRTGECPQGTHYSFETHSRKMIDRFSKKLQERRYAVFMVSTRFGNPEFPECAVIPLPDTNSEIIIGCERVRNHKSCKKSALLVHLAVYPVGTARNSG